MAASTAYRAPIRSSASFAMADLLASCTWRRTCRRTRRSLRRKSRSYEPNSAGACCPRRLHRSPSRTERAVADREVRRDLEPTLLDVDNELTPALRTLAHPGLEADEFLPALGCCTDGRLPARS
jgi:hypothetical protein